MALFGVRMLQKLFFLTDIIKGGFEMEPYFVRFETNMFVSNVFVVSTVLNGTNSSSTHFLRNLKVSEKCLI